MRPPADGIREQRPHPRTKRGGSAPVLICYDGSNLSKAAIAEAGRELGPRRRALVLTVWEPSVASGGFAPASVVGPADEEHRRRAGSVAEEGVALARDAGFEAEPLVEMGAPVWRRIVDVARAHEVDLIVLGSHGRSGLRYLLRGSIAAAVAQHAARPALIVSGAATRGDAVAA